ncbi:MAG: TIM barrel protein [Chloroflexi bacterium]|nr:TIM barrel protein [Chloroflexota bacterium]
MNPIGIMQGRLSPPIDGRIQAFPSHTWRQEFAVAADLGFSCLDWVYDTAAHYDGPLLTEEGIAEIRRISERTRVEVYSICGDYFRDFPLVRADARTLDARLQDLRLLIIQCRAAAIGRIMIPFVDSASILSDDDFHQAVAALQSILPFAEAHGVVITLETSLEPVRYRHFLECVNHPALRVTYDIGDCVSLGHDTMSEIELLAQWIESVHVKDRLRGGVTVPLGEGDADFAAAFSTLARLRYTGPFILQAARGEMGAEIETVRQYLQFVRRLLTVAYEDAEGLRHLA